MLKPSPACAVDPRNITQYERPALSSPLNLTDGHMHQPWSESQLLIVERMPDLFKAANRERQAEAERRFVDRFSRASGQTIDGKNARWVLCSSASMSIEIVANYLRLKGMSLSLMEPCFDNLADIFKRHHIPLEPVPDEAVRQGRIVEVLSAQKCEAILLVLPNNPTGTRLCRSGLKDLLAHCQRSGKILIVDSSFRFYDPEYFWDQYELLGESDAPYIVVEDTGKTWPTQEVKVSILAMHPCLWRDLYDVYTDMTLHISPFVLDFVGEFLEDSRLGGLARLHAEISQNRRVLYSSLDRSLLVPVEEPFMSLSWLFVERGISADFIRDQLAARGVNVLSGRHFFWSSRENDSYLRVALARSARTLEQAAKVISEVCCEVDSQHCRSQRSLG